MNKCSVPDYTDIVKQFELLGIEKFVKIYRKYEALIGESKSIRFIEDKIEEYKSN